VQLIGLKMEVEEDEFDVDREGLSIAAGINENLSEQVGSPAHVLEQEDRVLESQTMLCNAGAGLHIPADSHAYIVEASCHADDLRSITKDITVFVVSCSSIIWQVLCIGQASGSDAEHHNSDSDPSSRGAEDKPEV